MKLFPALLMLLPVFGSYSAQLSPSFLSGFKTMELPLQTDFDIVYFNIEDYDEDGNVIPYESLPIEEYDLSAEEVEELGYGSANNYLYKFGKVGFPNGMTGLIFYHWSFSQWNGQENYDYILEVYDKDGIHITGEVIRYEWDDNDYSEEYDENAETLDYGKVHAEITYEKNLKINLITYSKRDKKELERKVFILDEASKSFKAVE